MAAVVHVLLWRLKGDTESERDEAARAVVAAVQALRSCVPGLLSVEVGANLVQADDAWDVGAVMRFRSRADLDAYQTDPAHLALKAAVGPWRRARAQIDFPA